MGNTKPNKEDKELKEFLIKLIGRWPVFVMFGILGLAIAFCVTKTMHPTFRVSSTLLIEDQENDATSKLSGLFGMMGSNFKTNLNSNVDNQIGILKTYTLSYDALLNLNRKVTWFEKGTLRNKELYKEDPFDMAYLRYEVNITGIPMYVTVLTDSTYCIRASGTYEQKDIAFTQNGTFGKAFCNRYCQFVLKKNKDYYQNGTDYYLVFNDLSKLAKGYIERLKVELTNKKADIISIQMDGNPAEKEVDFLNELNRMLVKYRSGIKNRTSENSLQFIDSQMHGISDSLRVAENRYSDFRSNNQIVDLDKEAEMILEKLKDLETQEFQLKMQIDYYRNLRKYMGNSEQIQKIASPSVAGIVDATLNTLVEKLIELYSKRRLTSFSAKDNSSVIQMQDEEINATCKSIKDNLANLQDNAEAEMKSLAMQIKSVSSKMSDLPQTEQKYINIKRQFDLNNDIYTFMLQKKAEVGITNASSVSDVQILDPARIETVEKIGPKKVLNLFIGLLMGCAIPFVYLLLTEYMNTKIQSREDIENESMYPVIGTIINNSNIDDIFIVKNLRSRVTESFRQLRIQLKYFLISPETKVICIHSLMPNEGKSFVSLNLASVFAIQGKRVLLVDADLRKSGLSKVISTESKPGLSDYLIHKNTLEEILIPVPQVPNMIFIPSGPIPPNSAELIENGFAEFLNEAKKRFDYIIVDTSPVIISDGIIIGSYSDVNLFITRFRFSHKKQLELINTIVKQNSIKNVAFVLNDIKISGKYGNSYYYGYGNSYYEEPNGKKMNEKKGLKVNGQNIDVLN